MNTADDDKLFLGRVPRPPRIESMLQAAERRAQQLRILLDAARKLEADETAESLPSEREASDQ